MTSKSDKDARPVWREPVSEGLSTWRDILWRNVEDYCENTTLHGYRYLTENGRHWVERVIWVIVHVLATWGVVFIILDVWREYLNTPTVTTVETTAFPISNVPFPAVAVCNLNKISRKAARRIADEMSVERNVSSDVLFESMSYLGRLCDFDNDEPEKLLALDGMLRANNRTYNVSELMRELTPSCNDLLVRCMWKGYIQNCSSLFKLRKTMEGFCCSFNYIRDTDDFISLEPGSQSETSGSSEENSDGLDPKIMTVSSPGYHMGLTVLVNPQAEDYYYPLISSFGTKILVFNPRDFPDTPSGGLIEKLVPLETEVFFRLDATTMYSVPSVKGFDISQRGCLFKSELSKSFGGSYSYSDCLMSCRVKSIETLCNCVPFFLPSRGKSRDCDMKDIPCLARYKEKWSTLRPTSKIDGLEVEMEVSISCEECLPACSDTTYHVQTTSAAMTKHRYDMSAFLEGVEGLNSHSVFHLFFGSHNSVKLKQDVLYYWYDLLSNFGGICGLFVGFSLISVVEFVYFFTLRLYFLAKDNAKDKVATETLDIPQALGSGQERDIYWREIGPAKSRRY